MGQNQLFSHQKNSVPGRWWRVNPSNRDVHHIHQKPHPDLQQLEAAACPLPGKDRNRQPKET